MSEVDGEQMYSLRVRRNLARILDIQDCGPANNRRCDVRQRVVALLGVTAAIAVVAQAVLVVGQSPTAAQRGPAAKTSWGEPDLQGIWTINYQIPLQRPAKYKDKASFTDAEIVQLDYDRISQP